MMSHSQFRHKRLKSSPKFECILDSDSIELFNYDTLYYKNPSWLNHIHQKRITFQKDRQKLTYIFLSLIAFFSILSLIFLISALVNYSETINNSYNDVINEEYSEYDTKVKFYESCHVVRPEIRIDCNPDPPISEEVCLKRGCCWNPIKNKFLNYVLSQNKALPPVDIPFCYFNENYIGYKIVKINKSDLNTNIHLKRVRSSGFPNDIQNVRVDIDELTNEMVRIKFVDMNKSRYRVPVPKLNVPSSPLASNSKLYSIELTNSNLIIRRRESGQAIFHVNLAILIYSDQFMQITTQLPSDFIYGLGEHRAPFRKATNWKRYTMFNRDQYPLPDMALYGSHPFYLSIEEYNVNKSASGVFLFNSNAMDIITQPWPAITFRAIGGILDFFIFFGPKPENVVSQYQKLIGLPQMPPFWSLGFHLSRFGYKNMSNLNATFCRNQDEKIPMDVQWTDIDVMDKNNDFTYDQKNFKDLPEFIEKILHENGMKFIPMFDCGISGGEASHSYPPYDVGKKMDIFIQNSTGQIFYGKVWNSHSTVWPDFFHPKAELYWTRMLAQYNQKIPFDGAWIDMNEPSNFFDGQKNGCPRTELETPRYTPGMTDDRLTLRHRTLCMTSRHYNGELHYNLHNLYGLQEAIITNEALKKILNKRPFIISRSTAPGHGHWAYHWTGDIISDWPSMKWSISSILNFNLFGIPMVGADICGFNGNTTEELCARWHQLGAFYTFARNHNTDDAIDQDPAALGPNVVQAARNALEVRYAHLPYLYTLFYQVHKNGGTVLRPLFFEFLNDENSYKIDSQFMWGPSLMITPVLSPNQKEIDIYFPKGTWFFVGNLNKIISQGEFISKPTSFSFPNVYYRSGSIIPIQKPKQTTETTRKGNFILIVALENETESASGQMYWDSGDGLNTEQLGSYNLYNFKVFDQRLTIESKYLGYDTKQTFNEIVILGFSQRPVNVLVNGLKNGISYQYKVCPICKLTINDINLPLYNHSSDSQAKIFHHIYWELI